MGRTTGDAGKASGPPDAVMVAIRRSPDLLHTVQLVLSSATMVTNAQHGLYAMIRAPRTGGWRSSTPRTWDGLKTIACTGPEPGDTEERYQTLGSALHRAVASSSPVRATEEEVAGLVIEGYDDPPWSTAWTAFPIISDGFSVGVVALGHLSEPRQVDIDAVAEFLAVAAPVLARHTARACSAEAGLVEFSELQSSTDEPPTELTSVPASQETALRAACSLARQLSPPLHGPTRRAAASTRRLERRAGQDRTPRGRGRRRAVRHWLRVRRMLALLVDEPSTAAARRSVEATSSAALCWLTVGSDGDLDSGLQLDRHLAFADAYAQLARGEVRRPPRVPLALRAARRLPRWTMLLALLSVLVPVHVHFRDGVGFEQAVNATFFVAVPVSVASIVGMIAPFPSLRRVCRRRLAAAVVAAIVTLVITDLRALPSTAAPIVGMPIAVVLALAWIRARELEPFERSAIVVGAAFAGSMWGTALLDVSTITRAALLAGAAAFGCALFRLSRHLVRTRRVGAPAMSEGCLPSDGIVLRCHRGCGMPAVVILIERYDIRAVCDVHAPDTDGYLTAVFVDGRWRHHPYSDAWPSTEQGWWWITYALEDALPSAIAMVEWERRLVGQWERPVRPPGRVVRRLAVVPSRLTTVGRLAFVVTCACLASIGFDVAVDAPPFASNLVWLSAAATASVTLPRPSRRTPRFGGPLPPPAISRSFL